MSAGSVRFRGQTTFQSSTAVGTTTAGSYVQLTVAGNSSAIFGAEIASMSSLFSRYRLNSLKVSVGQVFGATNRYLGVKYISENTSAPGVVTCLSLMDGDHSAVAMAPQVTPAVLKLSSKELDKSGILWRECDDSAENLGVYGELTIIQELAGAIFVHFEWDISFADLAPSSIHLAPFGKALGKMRPTDLIRLAGPLPPRDSMKVEEEDFQPVRTPAPSPNPTVPVLRFVRRV